MTFCRVPLILIVPIGLATLLPLGLRMSSNGLRQDGVPEGFSGPLGLVKQAVGLD